MSDARDFPYLCPNCSDPPKRFLTVVGLWSHLENKHPYSNSNLGNGDHGDGSGNHGNAPSNGTLGSNKHNRGSTNDVRTDTKLPSYDEWRRNQDVNDASLVDAPAKRTRDSPLGGDRSVGSRSRTSSRNNLSIYLPTENGMVAPSAITPGSYADYPVADYDLHDGKSYSELLHVCDQLRQDLRVKEVRLERANEELERLALDRRKLQRELLDLSKDPGQDPDRMVTLRRLLDDQDEKIKAKEG